MEYKEGNIIKLVSEKKLLKRIKQKGLHPSDFDEIRMKDLIEMLGHSVEICTFWGDQGQCLELWNLEHNDTWWFHEIAVESSCIQT